MQYPCILSCRIVTAISVATERGLLFCELNKVIVVSLHVLCFYKLFLTFRHEENAEASENVYTGWPRDRAHVAGQG